MMEINIDQLIHAIMNDQQKMALAGVFVFVVLESVVCFFLILRAKAFLARAVRVRATINKIETVQTSKSQFDRLFIEYHDRVGRRYEGKIAAQVGQYKTDGQVEVLYDPQRPEKVKSTNRMQFFAAPVAALVGAGVIMVVVSQMLLGKL